ncbi:MAG: WxcM-like domain-containing protein [Deltaproteobacteria bacterium]|nr:WxcM-like domain-containing protein [Deltaproteobacteria bacterium]
MSGFFVHPKALVESEHIGEGTRIWAFAHVLKGARLGGDCNICDGVFVESKVVIGDRVTIKSGVQVWDGVTLEDDVFVGPNATFTNDLFPRSKVFFEHYPETLVERGASIGANATILPGLVVGRGAMVGAGAVVTQDVPPYAVVVGNPARVVRYVDPEGEARGAVAPDEAPLTVAGVAWVPGVVSRGMVGRSVSRQLDGGLPFAAERVTVHHEVGSPAARRQYALKSAEQLLVCLQGELTVEVDDGATRQAVRLEGGGPGLHLAPLVYSVQRAHSADAILMILASLPEDPADRVEDYATFQALLS